MTRVRTVISRARSMSPAGMDRLLFGVFLVAAVLEALVVRATAGQHAILLAVELAIAVAMLRRRSQPIAGMLLMSVALIAADLMGRRIADSVTVPFIALFVFSYALGAYRDGREIAAGLIAGAVGILHSILGDADGVGDLVSGLAFASVFVGGPMFVGRSIRNRRLLAAALAEKAERVEREREEGARRAVDDERARIARELHDVVAHSISVMTVQAEAVGRIADRYPEQARSSLETIETTGREALTEMRRLLGVLRRDDTTPELAPQPSLVQVRTLVERARSAGLEVELEVEGEPKHLSAGVDLAAYRVVQEALRGALRSGGARRARVAVRYGERNVRLEIADDGPAFRAEEDAEMAGMRERVALYGGELEGAAAGDGGHVVRARLPFDLVAA